MKNVKISSIIIAVSALFLAAGCSGLTSAVESRSSSGESTVTVSASCAPASSADAAVRSAYPSFDASGLYLTLTAESSGCAPVTVTADSKASASLVLIRGKTWTVTADFYKDSARTVKCLTGHTETTPSEVAVSLSISVAPVSSSSGTGSISLLLKNDAATVYTVTAQLLSGTASEPAALQKLDTDGKAIASTDTTTLPSYWKFAADSVAAGTYTYQFVLYDASGARTGFFFDAITVYSGMTTDTWYVGGTSVNAFGIKSYVAAAAASQIFYVSGTQGTGGQVLPTGSDTAGTGTFTAPYATLGKALAAVNAANDGTSAYTIVVDGTINTVWSGAVADTPGLGYICPAGKNLTLTIKSLLGTATLDASSLSGVPVLMATGQYSLKLTLQGLTLAAGSSTTVTADSVSPVCIEDTSAGSLTIDSCTVKNGIISVTSADAEVTLSSTTISGLSETATVVEATNVTLADSALDITGIVKAGIITAKAVPDKAVSVEPSSVSSVAATDKFLNLGTGVTLDSSKLPLWDTTDYYYFEKASSAYGVMPVQELTYSLLSGTGALTAAITYPGTKQSLFGGSTVYPGSMYSTVDRNGQIYILYISDSTYSIYSAGKTYTVPVSGASFCSLNDGTGSLLAVNSDRTGFYKLTLDGTAYTSTVITMSDSNALSISAVTSVKADDGTQYVYYAYTSNSSTPYVPRLAAAVLSDDKLTTKWTADVSLDDSGIYSLNVSITDMTITSADELYLLLSDSNGVGFTSDHSNYYFTSRGALIDAGKASTLAAQESVSSLSLTPYGWRNKAGATITGTWTGPGNVTLNIYAQADSTYSNFVGPQRFIAVTPKKITMADYGYYIPDTSSTGKYDRKRGTVEFSLSDSSLSFIDPLSTDTLLYGAAGSEDSISCYCEY